MFNNLYVKTNYSLLSSLVSIDDLILYAKNKNMLTLCICDDNLNSTMFFYSQCIANNIKPVIGLEIKLNSETLLLYAMNYEGYKNLIKLSTILSERTIEMSDLKKYSSNLILILPFNSIEVFECVASFYEYTYIGVINKSEEKNVIESNMNPVFINKILYLDKNNGQYLKYLFMIRDNKTISSDVEFEDDYNYPLELERMNIVSSLALNNIDKICDMCNLEIPKRNDLLPIYNDEIDGDKYLVELSLKGINKRFNQNVTNDYKYRLKYELDVIKQMGFSNYFLVVYDFIRFAKKNNILVGPGRGSAAGSLVAYSLGITDIDPIKYDLLFERFLNPERVTMPDIDTDFPDIYRNDVIEYVKQKYGEKRVSGIITFGTMAPKLVLRDVGRVLNISSNIIDSLCKHIPGVTKLKLKDFYDTNEDFKNIIQSSDKLMLLYKVSTLLEGFPRHASTHAAGVVMGRESLDEVIPLVKNDGIYVSGFTMEFLETLGLLKMDFLGIKNLTTIMNIISDVEKNEGIKIDFSKIPLDDKKTLKLFEQADTCGIFQFESEGMKDFLRRLKPNSLDDIFAAIALFRPGPAVNIDSYIARKEGKEPINYIVPELEPILKPTYGIIIYQEQIMQIANIMAGFSLGEADLLRRAMSKKKLELLKGEQQNFIAGSVKRGYTEEIANKVFDLILNFANYGFNKSHSVSYSIVAYKMAYLKAYYSKYFFSNLLTSVIGNESKTLEYMNELRKMGVKIKLPNINVSSNKYEVVNDEIVFPLSNIKNIGVITCKDIMSARVNEFVDIYDCFSKIISKNVNKSVIEHLIDASCFEMFGYNKKTLHYNLDNLLNYALLTRDLDPDFVIKPEIEVKEEYTRDILLKMEKEVFGFYFSNHPSEIYKSKLQCNYVNINDIAKYFGKKINIIGLFEKIKVIKTKTGQKMAFALIGDNTGQIDITLFPELYNEYKHIEKGQVVLINGEVQKRYNKYQIIVKNITEVSK